MLGLHSFGGSFAYLCPRSGISVAILLNDCQLDYSVRDARDACNAFERVERVERMQRMILLKEHR